MNLNRSDIPSEIDTYEKLATWVLVQLENSGASQISVDQSNRSVSHISPIAGTIQKGDSQGKELFSGRFYLFLANSSHRRGTPIWELTEDIAA